MAFDPDKYLAKKPAAFDPDAYLAKAVPPAAPVVAEIPRRRGPSLADIGDRATGFRPQVEATGMTPEQRQAEVAGLIPYAVGLAAGPAAGAVIRGAGVAAPVISRFTAPLAEAVTTSGFRTGVSATAPATQRIALRVAGGAIPGAITGAAVSPEEIGTGAVTGAAISLLAPPVAKIVAKGGGAVVDALQGRSADVRANQLLRTAVGSEVNALRQAMAAAPDQPASRVAANLDLPVLQALLAEAEKKDPRGVVNAFRAREAADTVNELSRIAGGPTAETARAARETAKESLGDITGRMREEAFAKARRTGEVVPKLQTIAADARAESKAATNAVRRFSNAVNKADDWAQNWVTQSRMVEQPGGGFAREYGRGIGEPGVRLPARGEQLYTYPGQLAASGRQTTVGGPFERQVIDEGGVIARRIGEAAEESTRAGARARTAEATLQSMKDRGLKPITGADLTRPIDRMLANPDIATNREASAALTRVNQMVGDWTNQFGVVTPEALYAIRKNAVAGAIRDLNPSMDAKAQARLAASVLTRIKPVFDDAIEQAGGKGFRDYLQSFERGMSDIRGMELADNIRKLYAKGTPESKKQIIDLVRGETPDVVEDLFGSGRYKISEEMAKDMPFLRKLADTTDLDLKAVQQAAAGRAALTEAQKKGSARLRFPFFTRASTAVNEVVAGLEQKVKAQTLDIMIRAAQSGREFNRVLDQIPAKERSAFLAQFKDPESWNRFSREVANAARTGVTAEVGESERQVRNALAQ